MLTQSTRIPAIARGKVRALVKAHKDWPAYLAGKDLISARARNADLLEFARMHPELSAQIAAVLGTRPPAAQAVKPLTPKQVCVLTATIEHLLMSVGKRRGVKPRVRRQMGKAA